MTEDRLELLLELRGHTGLTLDFLHDLFQGLPSQAVRASLDNISELPQYKKSSGSPYVSRNASAPFNETREPPVSHDT